MTTSKVTISLAKVTRLEPMVGSYVKQRNLVVVTTSMAEAARLKPVKVTLCHIT